MFGVGLIMLLTILAVIVVLILVSCIRIVRQAQALVIERLGALIRRHGAPVFILNCQS